MKTFRSCSTDHYKVEILHSLLTPGHVLPHGKRQGRFKPWGDSKLSITEFENQQQHTFFFPCTRNMELIPCHLYLLFLDKSQIVFSRVFDNSELNLIKLSITEFENQQPCRRNIELIPHHLYFSILIKFSYFRQIQFYCFP